MSSLSDELPERIAGTITNRADLLLALAAHDQAVRDDVAGDCGFEQAAAVEEPEPVTRAGSPPARMPQRPKPKPQPVSTELRWLQAVAFRRIEGAQHPGQDYPEEIGSEPISEPQLDAQPYRIKPQALQPWSRLWPWLHHVQGNLLPGRQLDLPRLVADMAHLRPVRRLPFRRRLNWAPQVHILVDGTRSMEQFCEDIHGLLARLRQWRGSEGFCCLLLTNGPEILTDADALARPEIMARQTRNISPGGNAWTSPGPGDTLLVLSDLGCLDRDPRRMRAWRDYGRHLQHRGVARFVLSPCPRDRWDFELARLWACSPWDQHERLPRGRSGRRPAPSGIEPAERQRMLDALLRIASVPLLIESPLLRAIRLLLPDADAGLEHDLRSHPEVSAVAGVCALKPQHVDRRMDELIAGDDHYLKRLKERLPELLRRHHQFHGVLLRASEIYNRHAAHLSVNDKERAWAKSVFQAGNRSRWDQIESGAASQHPGDQLGLAAWNARELARKSHTRAQQDRELAAASALEAVAGGSTAEPPEGIHRETYRQTWQWALAKRGEPQPRLWQLRQHGRTLRLESPREPCSAGTPVARVCTANPSVFLTFNNRSNSSDVYFRADREDGRRCSLGMPDRISVGSDCCELDLLTVPPPAWASRFGWDRFGLFADFELHGVAFPLRWIPPGEFQMGSTKDEPEQIDWEEPQHRVTIGRGFWMAATPVTQAQYAAVTGQRPPHFQHAGDRAPVEQVDWDDCRKFCLLLQQKVAKLDPQTERQRTFRLPSEAEWEYACRAGTTTALYTGPLTIVGERNGPELDPIAWYGGNSGVEYEGAEDSSGWPEKQQDHRRAGTHPVGEKAPNPWGLYDMLGNVWEWCEDAWHYNYVDAPDDGTAWVDEGAAGGRRVSRGGSWAGHARYCRCAYRDLGPPAFRLHYLGFRFVLASSFNEGIGAFP